jgi:hypothetical protein
MLGGGRPARIQLPEFDRFAATALQATHVKAPTWETTTSIPSLLLGRTVLAATPKTSDLLLQLRGERGWKSFHSQPTLFTEARAAGLNAGLSGWHHPYCRVIGQDLSDCAWDIAGYPSVYVARYLAQQPLYRQALYLLDWDTRKLPFLVQSLHWATAAPDQRRLWRENNAATAQYVIDNGLRMLRNPKLDLVFLHFPFPHPPGIWNSAEGRLTDGSSNYVDNLELADWTLRQIRVTLEAAGEWDSSTILVSSDHPFRPDVWSTTPFLDAETAYVSGSLSQPYIPFLLKVPYQKQGMVYDREFNSVLSADLLWQSLTGKLQSSAQVVLWLDQRRTGKQ